MSRSATGDRGGEPPAADGRPATSWAARFGRVILEHGLATIPVALFHHQGALQLSAQDVWFISYILARKWKADLPYPSLKQMELQTGVPQRHLQYVRAGLEQHGYLRVEEQYEANQRQTTNRYDFGPLFAALETLIAAEAPPENAIQADDLPPGALDVPDTSFIARYGRVLARAGIATVPLALFTHQRALALSPQQVWFVAYILAHKWTVALPYPSLKKMALRTGYSDRMLRYTKSSLIEAGYLRLVPRFDPAGAQDSNAYDFGPLLERIAQLVQQEEPAGAAAALAPPRRPVGGQRRSRAERVAATQTLVSVPLATTGRPAATASLPSLARPPRAPEAPPPAAAPARRPLAPPRPADSRPEAAQVPAPPSPYLSALMQDLSRELHDEAHTRSNVTQAQRLWQRLQARTGLTDTAFGEQFVQVARRRTRQAQGGQGLGQIENKMAYFFEVLRDLVEQQLHERPAPVWAEVAHG